jgi:hypothetical protein
VQSLRGGHATEAAEKAEALEALKASFSAAAVLAAQKAAAENAAAQKAAAAAGDKRMEDEKEAAVRIQSLVRGQQERRHVQSLRERQAAPIGQAATAQTKQANVKAGLKLFRSWGAENNLQRAYESDDSSDTQEEVEPQHQQATQQKDEAQAAVKIQALARGKQERRNVQSLRESQTALLAFKSWGAGNNLHRAYESDESSDTQEDAKPQQQQATQQTEEEQAAVKIQSLTRGQQERRHVQSLRERQTAAAAASAAGAGNRKAYEEQAAVKIQ